MVLCSLFKISEVSQFRIINYLKKMKLVFPVDNGFDHISLALPCTMHI